METCWKCGREINGQKNFCPYCGAPLKNNKDVDSAAGKKVADETATKETTFEEAVIRETMAEEAVSEKATGGEAVSEEAAPKEEAASGEDLKESGGKKKHRGLKIVLVIVLAAVIGIAVGIGAAFFPRSAVTTEKISEGVSLSGIITGAEDQNGNVVYSLIPDETIEVTMDDGSTLNVTQAIIENLNMVPTETVASAEGYFKVEKKGFSEEQIYFVPEESIACTLEVYFDGETYLSEETGREYPIMHLYSPITVVYYNDQFTVTDAVYPPSDIGENFSPDENSYNMPIEMTGYFGLGDWDDEFMEERTVKDYFAFGSITYSYTTDQEN